MSSAAKLVTYELEENLAAQICTAVTDSGVAVYSAASTAKRSLNNNLYKTRLLMYVLSSEELRKANQRVTFLSGAPLVAANEYLE